MLKIVHIPEFKQYRSWNIKRDIKLLMQMEPAEVDALWAEWQETREWNNAEYIAYSHSLSEAVSTFVAELEAWGFKNLYTADKKHVKRQPWVVALLKHNPSFSDRYRAPDMPSIGPGDHFEYDGVKL